MSTVESTRDRGFTLVELLVTVSLLGTVMGFAVGGWTSWARASEHSGTARELQSVLRQAQQRAVTEGRAVCVDVDVAGNRYTMFRGACDDAARVRVLGPVVGDSADVRLSEPSFSGVSGTSTGVTFSSRGTAWPGQVKVTREGSTKQYVVRVEGLTGRVSLA